MHQPLRGWHAPRMETCFHAPCKPPTSVLLGKIAAANGVFLSRCTLAPDARYWCKAEIGPIGDGWSLTA